ncbi:MAG: alpha/beta fold hydrolase, partial [Vicinamibacterales bacterium]
QRQTVCLDVRGYRLTADVTGDLRAPAVLLLHGIPGGRRSWHAVADRLASGARVFAPDLVGFGDSRGGARALHAAEQSDVIAEFIRAVGLARVHVVGFDFGGPTAVLLATRAPALVVSLTLAATNVLTDTPIPVPLHLVRPPIVGDLFARLFFSRAGLSAMWRAAVARRERYRFADYRAVLREGDTIASTRQIFQASLRDLPGLYGPVETGLGLLRVPSAVVWGDRDPFFPVEVGRRTAARVAGASFIVLKGCGHFIPNEEPDALADIIMDAVAKSLPHETTERQAIV